jgi:hypothetical protein
MPKPLRKVDYETKATIKGMYYHEERVDLLKIGRGMKLVRDRQNINDSNAIQVLTPRSGIMLGYIDRTNAAKLAKEMDGGAKLTAVVASIRRDTSTTHNPWRVDLNISVQGGLGARRPEVKAPVKSAPTTVKYKQPVESDREGSSTAESKGCMAQLGEFIIGGTLILFIVIEVFKTPLFDFKIPCFGYFLLVILGAFLPEAYKNK